MYCTVLFAVIVGIVDIISGRPFIYAFHIPNEGAATGSMRLPCQRKQQLSLSRNPAIPKLPICYPFTTHSTIQQSIKFHRQSQRRPQKFQAIHEPQSDITSSEPSQWSLSLLFERVRIKDRHQLSSIVSAAVIIGLSSYYFYKGLYSISSSVSFWKAEGDLILNPMSVATWSAELIGYVYRLS